MDPNATLKEMLDITRTLLTAHDLAAHDLSLTTAWSLALAEHVEALDNWLRAGGFLPRRWAPTALSLTLSTPTTSRSWMQRPVRRARCGPDARRGQRAIALSTSLDALS
jgi:hypothetical protein